MHNNYKCPKCDGQLRLHDNVVLTAVDKSGKGSIVLLHAEIGNYTVDFHPDIKFEKGDLVTFLCPICHQNFSSKEHENLAMVIMADELGKEYNIYFSRITGEHSTVKMYGEHVELYGPHSGKYLDFYSMSQLY